MLAYHGIIIVPLAVIGAVVGLKRRSQAALLAVGWLLLALDFASFGIIETLFGWLLGPLLRYDYPFSVAWHGPIIPYMLLGGIGLLWLYDKLVVPRPALKQNLRKATPVVLIAGIGIVIVGIIIAPSIQNTMRGFVQFYGAFSSEADVQAMEWLRANTPEDSRILNYSQPHEADWAPLISERDTVYYRPQPFFEGDETSLAEQERLRAFWQDPANPDNEQLLRDAGVSFVLLPQIIGNADAISSMWRWREPFIEPADSRIEDAAYLTEVFDADGARVYQLNDG